MSAPNLTIKASTTVNTKKGRGSYHMLVLLLSCFSWYLSTM